MQSGHTQARKKATFGKLSKLCRLSKENNFLPRGGPEQLVCAPFNQRKRGNSHLCFYSYARILCILKPINHSKRSNVDALLGLRRRKPGYVNHFRDKLIYVLAGKSYEICSSPPTKFNSGFMLFLQTFAI